MAVKSYEMTLVLDPPQDGNVDEIVSRYQDLLSREETALVHIDRRGTRKLAYEVNKRQQGDYTIFQFNGEPGRIANLDRACRLDESVLRHLIVHVEEGFPEPEEPVEEEAQSSDASTGSSEDHSVEGDSVEGDPTGPEEAEADLDGEGAEDEADDEEGEA